MTRDMDRRVCVEPLLRKLRARDSMDEEEARVVADSIADVRLVPVGSRIIAAGQRLHESTLLVDGIVSRQKDLSSGVRQIQELHVSGDFVDLHGFLLKKLDHDIVAVSDCRFATVPHDRLTRITEQQPHLTRMLWFSTVLDAAIQRETILSIGRRDALSRIAHLMCELCTRLAVVGECEAYRFRLPMRQADLADATGLTPVHTNRMLKQLRDRELLTFRGGEAAILNWPELARVAEFDPAYLHLEKLPH